MAQRYTAVVQGEAQNRTRNTLQSRERVSGTDLSREIISVTYDAGTYQPLAYTQVKRSLLPVDSAKYSLLQNDTAYAGRLVSTKNNTGHLFFAVREEVTQYRFINISHELQIPPAREPDRVLMAANGVYQPAKGYEGYMVRSE